MKKIVKSFKEWVWRKKMITPEPILETLADATDVINPKFIAVGDYIFLNCGNENLYLYESYKNSEVEKAKIEAMENHVHLCGGVKNRFRNNIKKISVSIAKNLLKCLKYEFPDKKFVVFLELNYKDSVIVRFHQIREKGELYIDPKYYKEKYDNGFFMMFT